MVHSLDILTNIDLLNMTPLQFTTEFVLDLFDERVKSVYRIRKLKMKLSFCIVERGTEKFDRICCDEIASNCSFGTNGLPIENDS